MSQCYLS